MAAASAPSPDTLLQHAAFVRAVARAALRGDQDVDDVVQETWVAALEGGAARAKTLRPWLGGVARRQAANQQRRRASMRKRERRAARPEAVVDESASEIAERVETGRLLVAAVMALEEPYRTAVLLRYYDDLPPREIARKTGVPVETARTRVKRGLTRLRRRFEEDAARRDRSAPALLLPLVDARSPPAALAGSLVGGLLAVKKIAMGVGIVVLLLLGGYVVRTGTFRRAPEPVPEKAGPDERAAVAGPVAPARLEGRSDPAGVPLPALPAPNLPAPLGATFGGVVVDPDGRPLAGVTVEVDRHPPWHAAFMGQPALDPEAVAAVESDDAGRFRLNISGGVSYAYVRARAPGWVAATMHGQGLSRGDDGRITMVPARPISVTVLDDVSGRPVEGAVVHGLTGVMTLAYLVQPPWPVSVAHTDARGRARLALPEGEARLLVHAGGYASLQKDGLPISEEGAECTVRVLRGGAVRGVVVDPDGEPVADATVHAFAPATWQADATTDASGTFHFEGTTPPLAGGPNVQSRTHVALLVTARGWPRAWHAFPAPGPGEEVSVRVALERGHDLPVRVRMADGSAPPDGSARVRWQDLGTRAHYDSGPGPSHQAFLEGGHATVACLPTGKVEVVVYQGTPWETKVEAQIPEEGDPDPLEIVVGIGLDLRVRVLDAKGEPVPEARVTAVPEDGDYVRALLPSGMAKKTDAEGRFVLKGIAAKVTQVVVDAPGFAPEVRRVDLSRAPPAEIEVRLGNGVIQGRVVHPDGRPGRVVVLLTLRIRVARGLAALPGRLSGAKTDAEGRFRCSGVGEGEYGVQVESADVRLLSPTGRLQAGDADVRLVVATKPEAAKLHVEAVMLDAATLEPILDPLQVELHWEGGGGHGILLRRPEPPGLFRTMEPYAPGTHRVRAGGNGWQTAEAVVELRWGETPPPLRLLLTRAE